MWYAVFVQKKALCILAKQVRKTFLSSLLERFRSRSFVFFGEKVENWRGKPWWQRVNVLLQVPSRKRRAALVVRELDDFRLLHEEIVQAVVCRRWHARSLSWGKLDCAFVWLTTSGLHETLSELGIYFRQGDVSIVRLCQ